MKVTTQTAEEFCDKYFKLTGLKLDKFPVMKALEFVTEDTRPVQEAGLKEDPSKSAPEKDYIPYTTDKIVWPYDGTEWPPVWPPRPWPYPYTRCVYTNNSQTK